MTPEPHRYSPVFWPCAVVGGGVCLYGLHGLIRALHGVASRQFIQWFVGADLVHDAIIAPAACLVGAMVTRFAPASARAPLRAGLFATAIVLAVAWAPLRGYGRVTARGNSSVLPLNYVTAVATVLIIVWALAAAWFAVGLLRSRARDART